MIFSSKKGLPLLALHAAALVLVSGLLPLMAEDEDLTTGKPPAALTLTPPHFTAPGFVRWLGDPWKATATVDPGDWNWNKDGSRLYLRGGVQQGREVWRGESGGAELRLEGYLPLAPAFAASEDGRWIAGQKPFQKIEPGTAPSTLALFRADTLEGIWETCSQDFFNIDKMSFSPDGKYLVVGVHKRGFYSLSILDAASGHRLKEFQHRWPDDAPLERPSSETTTLAHVAPGPVHWYVLNDAVLLAPILDNEHRVTRLSLPKLEITPLGEPVEEEWRNHGFLVSPDEHWLSFLTSADYLVAEWTGSRYEERFRGEVEAVSEQTVYTCGVPWTYFSPGSSLFIFSGGGRHKVFRLSDQKVLHESDTEELVGNFTPDGRTFWRSAPIFQALDASTWKEKLVSASPARHQVTTLQFSPEGNRLLFGSRHAAEIWDIDGDQPLATLQPLKGPTLASFLWNAKGTQVYGSERGHYVRWKLPDKLGAGKTKRIVGQTLFDLPPHLQAMEPKQRKKLIPSIVAVDSATDACLVTVRLAPFYVDLRYPDRPEVVDPIKLLENKPNPIVNAFFSARGQKFFYSGQETLFDYDMRTGHLRQSLDRGSLVGYDPLHHHLITLDPHSGLDVLDAGTGALLKKLFMPQAAYWEMPAAVSPDGRWLFCLANVSKQDTPWQKEHKITLVDLEQGKLAALLPEADSSVRCASFSADSASLALGHLNGCVSIWKVAAMAESPPRDMQLADRSPAGERAARRAARSRSVQGSIEPIKLTKGGSWLIDNQGSLTTDLSDMQIGQCYINGLLALPHGQQSSRPDSTSADHENVTTELRDVSGNYRVQRVARIETSGQISFVDEWENLSDSPQDLRIDFMFSLGVDYTALRCENGNLPEVRGRELLFTGGQNHISATIPSLNDQPDQMLGLAIGSSSATLHPVVSWDFRRQILVSQCNLHLAPFQRRVTCVDVLQHPSQGPEHPFILSGEWQSRGFETHIPSSVVDRLLNFAVEAPNRELTEKFNQSHGLEADGSTKDVLGFHWRNTGSMEDVESELGAERILPLWLNRQPLGVSHNAIHKGGDTNSDPDADPVEYSSPDTPLKVQRRTLFSPEAGCYITHDTFINPTEHPVAVPADYLIVARSQIASVIGGDGQKLELTEPFPVKNCQGRLAVIFEGDAQPALVIDAGDPKAALLPVLLYFPNSALFLHYDINLKPGGQISIATLAAPRSLSTFDKPVDAFVGLKPPADFPRFQAGGVLPAANWQTPGQKVK